MNVSNYVKICQVLTILQ